MEFDRESALRLLADMALSKPNDAISLALDPGKVSPQGLDLMSVSELHVNSTKGMELKFIDRVRAVALLLENLGSESEGARALLDALREDGP